jgi:hypothetical protein
MSMFKLFVAIVIGAVLFLSGYLFHNCNGDPDAVSVAAEEELGKAQKELKVALKDAMNSYEEKDQWAFGRAFTHAHGEMERIDGWLWRVQKELKEKADNRYLSPPPWTPPHADGSLPSPKPASPPVLRPAVPPVAGAPSAPSTSPPAVAKPPPSS